MEPICALALCLLLSLCSATSPQKPPTLTPLNCNETNSQVGLATDLINEKRREGFVIRPVRTLSIFEQQVNDIHCSKSKSILCLFRYIFWSKAQIDIWWLSRLPTSEAPCYNIAVAGTSVINTWNKTFQNLVVDFDLNGGPWQNGPLLHSYGS